MFQPWLAICTHSKPILTFSHRSCCRCKLPHVAVFEQLVSATNLFWDREVERAPTTKRVDETQQVTWSCLDIGRSLKLVEQTHVVWCQEIFWSQDSSKGPVTPLGVRNVAVLPSLEQMEVDGGENPLWIGQNLQHFEVIRVLQCCCSLEVYRDMAWTAKQFSSSGGQFLVEFGVRFINRIISLMLEFVFSMCLLLLLLLLR